MTQRLQFVVLTFFLLVLFSIVVTAAELDITGVTPANGAFIGKNVTFAIKNTTGVENNNLTIYHVEYYQGTSVTLFANVSNTTIGVASAHELINYQVSNTTFGFSDAKDTQIIVRVYYMNLTRSITALTVQNHTFTTITIDNTKPGVGIEIKDKDLNLINTPFNVFFGDTVNIDCNPSDATAGLANVTILVSHPTISEQSISNVNADGEAAYTITDTLGDYKITCRVYDRSVNTNNQTLTFTVIEKPPENGAYSIPGFKEPVSSIIIGVGSSVDVGELDTDGISRLMGLDATATMLVNGEAHSFTVNEVGETSVVLTVASTPFDVEIPAGETVSLDVNADGVNDVSATLHMLYKGKADLTFRLLEGDIVPPVAEDSEEQTVVQPPAPFVEEEKSSSWVYTATLLIIAVLLVFIVLRFLRKRGKEGNVPSEKVRFTPRDLGAGREQTTIPYSSGNAPPGVPDSPPRRSYY